jgi:hypothetical protein
MPDVPKLLHDLEQGDPKAAEDLLPLVYDDLRRLAVAKMASQPSGHTIQPTALVHEALDRLAVEDPIKAELIKLRFFVGLGISEAAEVLGLSATTAKRHWTFARAWLRRELESS